MHCFIVHTDYSFLFVINSIANVVVVIVITVTIFMALTTHRLVLHGSCNDSFGVIIVVSVITTVVRKP